jgi:hypothetical protein
LDTSTPSVSLTFQVSIEDAEVLMAIYAVLTSQWSKHGSNSVSLNHLGSHLLYLAEKIEMDAPDDWLGEDFEEQLVARFVRSMETPEEVRDGSS